MKLIFRDVPDPRSPVAEHGGTRRLAEAAARRFSPDALGEGRTCGSSVQRACAFQGSRVGDRSFITDGRAFCIERFRTPDGTEFYFAGLRRSVRLLADAAREFFCA